MNPEELAESFRQAFLLGYKDGENICTGKMLASLLFNGLYLVGHVDALKRAYSAGVLTRQYEMEKRVIK